MDEKSKDVAFLHECSRSLYRPKGGGVAQEITSYLYEVSVFLLEKFGADLSAGEKDNPVIARNRRRLVHSLACDHARWGYRTSVRDLLATLDAPQGYLLDRLRAPLLAIALLRNAKRKIEAGLNPNDEVVRISKVIEAIETSSDSDACSYERVLEKDPAGSYRSMSAETKHAYRLKVEKIAAETGIVPEAIAEAALSSAKALQGDDAHIGFQLFMSDMNVPSDHDRIRLRAMIAIASVSTAGLVALFAVPQTASWLTLIAFLAFLGPARIGVEALIAQRGNQVPIFQMDYEDAGLPTTAATAIAIPIVIHANLDIEKFVNSLRRNLLVVNDTQVRAYVLGDLPDGPTSLPSSDETTALLKLENRLRQLNLEWSRKFGFCPVGFTLRNRTKYDGKWYPEERKRGNLDRLFMFLAGQIDLPMLCEADLVPCFRYVLCLDEDTLLTRNALQALVAHIDHPMNRPKLTRNPHGQGLVRGYGAAVPAVYASTQCARDWKIPSLVATTLFDENARQIPKVRSRTFDLYGVANHQGKALHDIQTHLARCVGALPSDLILSHDTVEGMLLRPLFVGSSIVCDLTPRSVGALASRKHRWIRGDVQNLALLFQRDAREKIGAVGADVVLGQLLDHLYPILLSVIGAGIIFSPTERASSLALVLILLASAPMLVGTLAGVLLSRDPAPNSAVRFARSIGVGGLQMLYAISTSLELGLLSLDAFARGAYRATLRRKCLEWTTMSSENSTAGDTPIFVKVSFGFATAFLMMEVLGHETSWAGLSISVLWMLAPLTTMLIKRR